MFAKQNVRGLRFNVDNSFQSVVRSYSKPMFVQTAPQNTAQFVLLDRQLRFRITCLADERSPLSLKCRSVLIQFVSNSLDRSSNGGGAYIGCRIGDDCVDTVCIPGIGGAVGGGAMPTAVCLGD